MVAESSGSKANGSGNRAEGVIGYLMSSKGWDVTAQKIVGFGIMGNPIKVDFYVSECPKFPEGLIVESKWQQSQGSVYEKFPYLVANLKSFYHQSVIVAGGGGCPPWAMRWLRSQVDGDRLIGVFNYEEFMAWLTNQ